jgi:hypothetical protein
MRRSKRSVRNWRQGSSRSCGTEFLCALRCIASRQAKTGLAGSSCARACGARNGKTPNCIFSMLIQLSNTHDLRTPQAMNMLDDTADQRIFGFERTSPFRGLLGGMFEAKIVLLTDISQQLPCGSIQTRELYLTPLSISADHALGIVLRMPAP